MKCPNCGREYTTRVRIRTMELVCNKCGYIGKLQDAPKESKDKAKKIVK